MFKERGVAEVKLTGNVSCNPQKLFALVLTPGAMLMGIPWEDCWRSGRLLGVKIITNEFVAYTDLIETTHELQVRKM